MGGRPAARQAGRADELAFGLASPPIEKVTASTYTLVTNVPSTGVPGSGTFTLTAAAGSRVQDGKFDERLLAVGASLGIVPVGDRVGLPVAEAIDRRADECAC
jgi:hypothetical protein